MHTLHGLELLDSDGHVPIVDGFLPRDSTSPPCDVGNDIAGGFTDHVAVPSHCSGAYIMAAMTRSFSGSGLFRGIFHD